MKRGMSMNDMSVKIEQLLKLQKPGNGAKRHMKMHLRNWNICAEVISIRLEFTLANWNLNIHSSMKNNSLHICFPKQTFVLFYSELFTCRCQGGIFSKKECALAHSRAERGRLRHVSASRECASSRSVFCFIGRNFLWNKKTADQFDQLLLNAVLRIFRCTLMILAIDSEALPLLLYTVFCRK